MSEEQNTETPPTEAPVETSTAETSEAPASTDSQVVNPKFDVNGETMTAEQIQDQAREVEVLREYQRAASNLMKNEQAALDEDRESDLRYVMSYEGYAPEQIDSYINSLKTPNPLQQTQEHPEMAANDPRVDEMAQRLQEVEKRESQTRLDALRSKLENAVSKVSTETGIDAISSSFKRIHGDDGHADRMKVLSEDIHRETVNNLRRVRSSGGDIDDASIRAASESAAKSVADRYRTVIGDPDKLGRAPETASGQDMFYKKKPIEIPQFSPGKDTTASVYEKAKTFAEDTLLDMAADISKGGDSKL